MAPSTELIISISKDHSVEMEYGSEDLASRVWTCLGVCNLGVSRPASRVPLQSVLVLLNS